MRWSNCRWGIGYDDIPFSWGAGGEFLSNKNSIYFRWRGKWIFSFLPFTLISSQMACGPKICSCSESFLQPTIEKWIFKRIHWLRYVKETIISGQIRVFAQFVSSRTFTIPGFSAILIINDGHNNSNRQGIYKINHKIRLCP